MIAFISSEMSLFTDSSFQEDDSPFMRNKQPQTTALVLAMCQTARVKYAFRLKHTEEVNPGKSHYN